MCVSTMIKQLGWLLYGSSCQCGFNMFSKDPVRKRLFHWSMLKSHKGLAFIEWIGLRENLQKSPIFHGKNHGFLVFFSQTNQSNNSYWGFP